MVDHGSSSEEGIVDTSTAKLLFGKAQSNQIAQRAIRRPKFTIDQDEEKNGKSHLK